MKFSDGDGKKTTKSRLILLLIRIREFSTEFLPLRDGNKVL